MSHIWITITEKIIIFKVKRNNSDNTVGIGVGYKIISDVEKKKKMWEKKIGFLHEYCTITYIKYIT